MFGALASYCFFFFVERLLLIILIRMLSKRTFSKGILFSDVIYLSLTLYLIEKMWEKRSVESKKLVTSLLNPDPKKRPSCLEALRTDWLKMKSFEKLDPTYFSEAVTNL
jgi:hypothetical protein